MPIFASHWLLPRLGQFLDAHPAIELQVEASPRMADMEAGLVDVALRYGDGSWPDVVGGEGSGLAPSPVTSPALAQRLKLNEPTDLLRAPLVRVSPRHAVAGMGARAGLDAEAFVARRGGAKGVQVDGMGAAVRAAVHGLGVALAFEPLIEQRDRVRRADPRRSAGADAGQIWFVCRPRERSAPAIRALRRWLVGEIAAMTAA